MQTNRRGAENAETQSTTWNRSWRGKQRWAAGSLSNFLSPALTDPFPEKKRMSRGSLGFREESFSRPARMLVVFDSVGAISDLPLTFAITFAFSVTG
jgi:hypothetical protein